MAFRRRYLTGLALVLLVGVPAATAFEPGTERTLSFTVFATDPIEGLGYVPYSNADPRPLVFYPTARSPVYTHMGFSPLQFVDARNQTLAAEIEISPEIRTALLILSPADSAIDGTRHYRVRVVDDSVLRYGPGELLIFNLSGLQLTGTINRHGVTLRDGLNEPIRVMESATINLRTPFRDRTYPAYSETLLLERSGRALLLLLPPYRQGSLEPQSRVLLDVPPIEAPPSRH